MKAVWKIKKEETEGVSFSFWYEKDNQEIFPPPLLYPPQREAIKEQIEKAREDIDTGDHVFHTLSREKWVVAIVRDDEVWYCGWPCGFGRRRS